MVEAVHRLIAGYKGFRARYYEQRPERMQALAEQGQAPDVMLIACSDSRVEPAVLLDIEPGELFIARNVANLVPPYGPDENPHGTSSAIEFAVLDLGVRHIIVLGHSGCGGIKALREAHVSEQLDREFIAPWMKIAEAACDCDVMGEAPSQPQMEQEGIRISLRNLMTFPWIASRVAAGDLSLHGWWVDLQAGQLCGVDPESDGVHDLIAGLEVLER
ncbi:MAG: carbonic anhydrase [Proteobacteria bacterium]|nr:carbonic anhydrase [Pseudomonadota bacterium]